MADDVIFQSMQRIGAGPIQIFYSTHLGRCWLIGPESLRELASHNEDPGVAASIGFGRLLPGRGRAMAAPEDAQLRVVHGCRRIAGREVDLKLEQFRNVFAAQASDRNISPLSVREFVFQSDTSLLA